MLLGTRKRGHVAAAAAGPPLLDEHCLGSYARPGHSATAAAAADPPLLDEHCLGSYARPGHSATAAAAADPPLLDEHCLGSYARPGHSATAAAAADPPLLDEHCLESYARPGHSAAAGDGLGAALLDALGLGSFARLDLPVPPDGLDLTAAVKPSSGCIIVSMGGDSITACPVDLVAALSLPLGKLELAAEDAALFSSAEAIAAVRVFVHDRLLLGGTGDGQVLPEEIVTSLQLVEDGKAYAVDWGLFVWAFLRSDVLIGKRRRCSQYLLRLMKCQRPDLFSEVDGRPLGKRREDQEYGNHANANVGPRLCSFRASRQQVVAHVSNLENLSSSGERTLAHTLAEIQQMREKMKEKDNQIKSITEDTKKELQAKSTKLKKLEHDEMLMLGTLHGCKRMFQESSAAFLEYRKMCKGSGVSSLDVVAAEKNQVHWMQQERDAHEIINGIEKHWLSKFSACDTKITVMLTKLADINKEVQRLKDSGSIQDLNMVPLL